jgi:uncharacterized repeat protein (TIGR01451 family)
MRKAWLALYCWAICGATDMVLPVGGKVSFELVFSDADFSNTMLWLAPPGAGIAKLPPKIPGEEPLKLSGCKIEPGTTPSLPGEGNIVPLLSEKPSQRGCRLELDADVQQNGIQPFPANTRFRFAMCAIVDATLPVCDYVWSSNPALNRGSGGYSREPSVFLDHLRIIPIRPGAFPNRIFTLAWEDFPSGGDFNDLVAQVRVDMDSDGDGLWDDWERFGLDANGDGVIDVDLPGKGARVDRKDIFVLYDYMDCNEPGGVPCTWEHAHELRVPTNPMEPTVIERLTNAFAMAPVDGGKGINLVMEFGKRVPHWPTTNFSSGDCREGKPAPVSDFDAIKRRSMGLQDPRRFTHRYALIAHKMAEPNPASGCAEVPGNDFFITLGSDRRPDGSMEEFLETPFRQASTFMHELGHTLGLEHGGGDGVNYKPNYLSVMNYSFQHGGIPQVNNGDPRMDYSRDKLIDLDETSLNELLGIGLMSSTDKTTWTCTTPEFRNLKSESAAGPINWNCLSQPNENTAGDITGDRPCILPGDHKLDLDLKVPGDPSQGHQRGGDDLEIIGWPYIHDGPNRICESVTKPGTNDVLDRPPNHEQARILTGHNDWANLKYDFQKTEGFEDGVHPTGPIGGERDLLIYRERLAPDPAVLKTGPLTAVTGTNVTFRINILNNATTTAENVVLADNLPASLAFVSCTAPGGVCGGNGPNRTLRYSSLGGGHGLNATLVANLSCATPHGAQIANAAMLASSTPDVNPRNNASSATLTAINPAPAIAGMGATPAVLTPPDRRMVPVAVNYAVTDNCPSAACTLAVSCNEPDCRAGQDWMVLDSRRVQLRADQKGGGAGRIYTITISCRDSGGAVSTRAVMVSVPASQSAAGR